MPVSLAFSRLLSPFIYRPTRSHREELVGGIEREGARALGRGQARDPAGGVVGEAGDGAGERARAVRVGRGLGDLPAEVVVAVVVGLAEGVGDGGDPAAGVVAGAGEVGGDRGGEHVGDRRHGPVGSESVHRRRLAAEGVGEDVGGEARVTGSVVDELRDERAQGACAIGIGGRFRDRAAELVVGRSGGGTCLVDRGHDPAAAVNAEAGGRAVG